MKTFRRNEPLGRKENNNRSHAIRYMRPGTNGILSLAQVSKPVPQHSHGFGNPPKL